MYRFRIYFFLLTLILTGSVSAKESSVLVMGDSLSAGYGIEITQGWAALLETEMAAKHQLKWINASVSGETTSGGKARLDQLLKTHQPDYVILELGGNDGLRGQPLNFIRNNLQSMIDSIHQQKAKILLLGMQIPPNYGARYAESFANIYSELAKTNNLLLVPFLLEGVATNPSLMQNDGIHPTAEGQPLVMENVRGYFEKLLE
ncbi:MAG: arylesterase [Cellvibrio sp.]|nr:arylesterase [Cellvibrio sp.]